MTAPDERADFVRELLDDAVVGVEPTDRLAAIQERTAAPRRRGWYVVGGASLAAAAAVVAVAVVASDGGDRAPDDVAATSTPAPTEPTAALQPPQQTTPVYYVGPGSDGTDGVDAALYRYFEPEGDPLELLMSTPSDPDYRTQWPEGSLLSFDVTDEAIVVAVAEPPADELATQQLVHTLQAVTETSLPVLLDHPTIDPAPVRRAPALDVLSHVNISDPGEAFVYEGSFTARGVGNGYEGTIACQLDEGDRSDPVWSGATIAGWMEERLFPWDLEVDLTGVAPGTYTFRCLTDDPTGGAKGAGSYTDTRTITVNPD